MAGITGGGGGGGGYDYIQDSEPADPSDGESWLDTSSNPYVEKVYNAGAGGWDAGATVTELNSHAGTSGAHHSRYTDSEARSAVNVIDWVEDTNGKQAVSGVGSFTHNLSQQYDQIRLVLHTCVGTETTATELRLQVDGDTGTNYNQRQGDGASATGLNRFILAKPGNPANQPVDGQAALNGRSPGDLVFHNMMACHHGGAKALYGHNYNVAMPMDSLTVFYGTGNIDQAEYQVFGRDL